MRVNNNKRTAAQAGMDGYHQTQAPVRGDAATASVGAVPDSNTANNTDHSPLSAAEVARIQQRQQQRVQQAERQGRRTLARSSAAAAAVARHTEQNLLGSEQSLLGWLLMSFQTKRHLYPEDLSLIDNFILGAKVGGSHYSTVKTYGKRLIQFSGWLRENNKGSISHRLFSPELNIQAKEFSDSSCYKITSSVLHYLRASSQAADGRVSITRCKLDERLDLPPEDQWLIQQAFPEKNTSCQQKYINILMHFSHWLNTDH